MNRIEKIISNYPDLYFEFEALPKHMGGLNINEQVTINSSISEEKQYQWLCEELGHVLSSSGDICDYSNFSNMQQEKRARKIGMKMSVTKEEIEKVISDNPENDYEVAEKIGVGIDYLHNVATIYGYTFKYGN